jgi:hypothetical protein
MSLLQLSKDYMEARSIFEAWDTAYIPIMASIDFGQLADYVIQNGSATLPPT